MQTRSFEWLCENRDSGAAWKCQCEECKRVRKFEAEWAQKSTVGGLIISAQAITFELVARGAALAPIMREYMTDEQYERYEKDLKIYVERVTALVH